MELLTAPVEPIPRLDPPQPPRSGARALFHVWFVEYNPIYLFSAALVLAGLTLLSCDLAAGDALGGFGVAAIAEVYAFALIAGAAFLRKLGMWRVAVMVGLLAALYQCDLTMHVETCAFLGPVGWAGAIVWVLLFATKLRLLAAALELRLSPSALLVPTLGAAGLALLPLSFRSLSPDARTALVAMVGFCVAAAALFTSRSVESAVGYDYRGRRALRGTWLLWAGGALLHVGYWTMAMGVSLSGLIPGALLLTTRWARRERSVWAIVLTTLVGVAWLDPSSISGTALMAAAVLALRAFRSPVLEAASSAPQAAPPYRGAGLEPEIAEEAAPAIVFEPVDPIAMERLLLGALTGLHLSVWTMTSSGGFWLAHVPPLDLALAAVCALRLWRGGRWQAITPLLPLSLHLAIEAGWLTPPANRTELGVWAIGIGFALLGGGLGVSWWSGRRRDELSDASS